MILKDEIRQLKEHWFKDHKAEFKQLDDNTQVIEWGNNKNCSYWVRYVLVGNFICVMGDVGEATYELTEQATIEKIAKGYDLSYFNGKMSCCKNRIYKFNSTEARARLLQWAHELREEDLLTEDKESIILELISQADECLSKEQWEYILAKKEDEIDNVDCEWWGWLPGIGDELNSKIIAYWVGLKMAAQQLGYETKYID